MLEINKELVLSTCHIEEIESNNLGTRNYSSDQNQIILHVESVIDDLDNFNYPNTLNCLHLAKDLDCKWLVLDCDGLEVEFLEKFDW